jgi:DNA-binding NarL/FixJ family response regulator
MGGRFYLAECLELVASAAGTRGQPERAARLFGSAEAVRQAAGFSPRPGDRASFAQCLAGVRAVLDDVPFAAAWAEGRALSAEQAIAEALDRVAPPQVGSGVRQEGHPADPAAALSPREHEVAALLARGLTNHQIAETLVISERTVEWHVGNILGKLGQGSRTRAAIWLRDHDLGAPRPG